MHFQIEVKAAVDASRAKQLCSKAGVKIISNFMSPKVAESAVRD